MKRLAVMATAPTAVALLVAAPALAAWTAAGSGSGRSAADRLQATSGGAAGSATSSSLRLSWSYPATGLQASGWDITRDGLNISDTCAYESQVLACTDSGLAPSRVYDYVLRAKRGEWRGGSTSFSGTTSAAAPVATRPTPVVTSPTNGSTTTTSVVVQGTTSDTSTVTVSYTDGAATGTVTTTPASTTSGFSAALPTLAAGRTYSVTASQTNAAGTGTSAPVSFTTAASGTPDTTPPTITSLVRAGSNPTNASSVSWTATFSESVTGVDLVDFALAPTSVTGALLTGVTGNGTTWTVTASSGVGNGSLGLNLVDNDSIVDGAGNRLGGTGAGNGNRTGEVYTVDKAAPTAPSGVTLAAGSDSGSSASDGTTNVARATFTGTAEAGSTVRVYRAGNVLIGTGTAATGGTFTIQIGTALADGAHTITARATDAADNESGASTAKSVTIDTAAPNAPVISTPAAGATGVTRNTSFSGTASEAGGAVVVTITSAGDTGGKSTSAATPTGTSPFSWTTTALANNTLTNNQTQTARAVHTDLAGNASAPSTSRTFNT